MSDPLGDLDILRFRMLADPKLSPDGGQVAFVLVEQDAEANRQASSIWSVSAEGSAPPRRLTAGPDDGRPRWSPDGSRLAFLSVREREWARDLLVLDMRGGEAERIAALPRGALEFAWSPDGDRLCLVGGPEYPAEPGRSAPATPAEANRRYRERVRHIRRFRYRFDGLGELDDEAAQLWVVNADGSGLRMITEGASDVRRPSWLDAERIAFLSNRRPDFDRSEVAEVYAVEAAGGPVTQLTSHETSTSAFGMAPDGRLATLRTDAPDPFDARHHRVWIDGECLTREKDRASASVVLADTMTRREPMDPTWSDSWLYFELIDGGRQHVYRARPGLSPQLVVGGDRVVAGFSTDGRSAAFLSSGPDDPLSLRLCN
ncbi:MAG: PD40 domain-containing protein, partial [Acidimicrobiia bacterium]|nr:PD40 domain-containing protein [Acidimicrobiia bacterium]